MPKDNKEVDQSLEGWFLPFKKADWAVWGNYTSLHVSLSLFYLCAKDHTGLEEQEKEKRRLVIEKFQKAPFEEIAAQCESKVSSEGARQDARSEVYLWSDPTGRLLSSS